MGAGFCNGSFGLSDAATYTVGAEQSHFFNPDPIHASADITNFSSTKARSGSSSQVHRKKQPSCGLIPAYLSPSVSPHLRLPHPLRLSMGGCLNRLRHKDF